MPNRNIITVFWTLLLFFIFILLQFFVPFVQDFFSGSILFLAPMLIFFLLGVVLTVLTVREKSLGRIKIYLLLTGLSAVGFLVFVIAHNMLYAVAVYFENVTIIKYLAEALHVLFFLIATIICPILFIVAVILSLKHLNKATKAK